MAGRPLRTLLLRALAGVVVVAIGAGVGTLAAGGGDRSRTVSAVASGTASQTTSTPGRVFLDDVLPAAPGAADRAAVERALRRLGDRRKVAQLFAYGLPERVPRARIAALRADGVGAVVFGGGNRRGLARALGAARGVEPLIVSDTEAAPRALRAAGFRGTFAPRLDVESAADARDAASIATDDAAAYRGAGVLAVATPFPGLGGATQPPTEGPANVTATASQLERRDMRPFQAAVDAGVPAVQMANGLYAYDDFVTPGSLSRTLIGGQLRGRLGFDGVVVTGNLAEAGVTALEPPARAAPAALRAGADLLYIGGAEADQRAAFDAVLAPLRRARRGSAYRRRVDDAVRHVLAAKRDYGLLR